MGAIPQQRQSGYRGLRKRLGGGYWRLEMRLELALGYGNAFGAGSGPERLEGGGTPPPFQTIPWGGGHKGGGGAVGIRQYPR